jgi:serine/threonine-protein kinase
MKALAKNPDNRFSSAAEMAADLERFTSGQKVHATPVLADETMVAPARVGQTAVMREADYPPEPSGRRAGLYVLVALILLGLLALGAWLVADNLLGGEPVKVPDVVGDDVDKARDELEDLGLDVDVVDQTSRKPIDEVIRQDPAAGEVIDEGDTVTLFVSVGAKQTFVPELEGLSLDEAEDALVEAKLRLGDVTREPDEEIEEDHVIRSDPASGEEVDQGSRVDLVVSSGAEPVSVPFVVGQTQEDAEQEIKAAGLEVEVVTEPSEDVPEGVVISQDPTGGSEAEPGDIVRIVVSEGPGARPLPDVTGDDGDDAEAFLEGDYGLDVTQVDETEQACAEPPGRVCRSDPEPGTPVEPGDDVTLFVQPGGASLPGSGWWAWAAGGVWLA